MEVSQILLKQEIKMTKALYVAAGLAILGAIGLGVWSMNKPAEPAPVPPGAEAATEAVREDMAERQNVEEKDVIIVSVTSREWPNSCLGMDKPNLICLQVITPGYEIVAKTKVEGMSKNYTYHTNASGSAIALID